MIIPHKETEIKSTLTEAGGGLKSFGDVIALLELSFPNLSSAVSGIKKATGEATGGFGKLKAAGTSALTSLSKLGGGLGKLIIPAAAIAALYAIFKHIEGSFDRAEEKFSKTSQESSELESELNSLNSELETTSSRIAELEKKGALSFTEVEELRNLQKQNAELERSIILAKQRQAILAQQEHTDFQDMMGKYFDSRNSNGENIFKNILYANSGQGVQTRSGILDSKLTEYEQVASDIAKIEKN